VGDEERDLLEPLGSSRRGFVKKMIAAGFAAPMIGSFGFAELASAACPPHHSFPNQTQHVPPPPPPPPPPHCDEPPATGYGFGGFFDRRF
jgi:hypothetical protein